MRTTVSFTRLWTVTADSHEICVDDRQGGGLVLMLDVDTIVKTYGQDVIRDMSTGRGTVNIQESMAVSYYARRDFEFLLQVPEISEQQNHVLTCLDCAELRLGGHSEEYQLTRCLL